MKKGFLLRRFMIPRTTATAAKITLASLIVLSVSSVFAQAPAYSATISPSAPGGYYLTTKMRIPSPATRLVILDSVAELVYYSYLPDQTTDFKLHNDGRFSYCRNKKFYLTDGNLQLADSLVPGNGFVTDNHDLQILPNGNFLLMGMEEYVQDLSSYPYFKNNGSLGSKNATVTAVVIQELDPAGNVVFQWKARDHFQFDDVDPFWLNDSARVDWTHSNAVHLDDDGNILLSSRHFNEITKISRSTGNVIWRFGGKKNMFTFTGDTTRFYGQHDCRRLPNGRLTLYDNGRHKTPHGARALRYQMDETNFTAHVEWQYMPNPSMFSIAMGNAQAVTGNRTLVNYGVVPQRSLLFDVVDSLGNREIRLAFNDSSYSYRSFHVTQLPVAFQRPAITCADSVSGVKLDGGAGYLGYKWNTGDTTRFISPAAPGNYHVMVRRGPNEYVRSHNYEVTGAYCVFASLNENGRQQHPRLYPNPAAGTLNVDLREATRLLVYNNLGQLVADKMIGSGLSHMDISSWANGLYLARFGNEQRGLVVRFVVNN